MSAGSRISKHGIKVMHMLRADSPIYNSFGEIYFSIVYPNAIKAWHNHHVMILNYAVPYGNIKFVLYDDRASSSTRGEIQEIFLGPDNYCLVTVPPLICRIRASCGRASFTRCEGCSSPRWTRTVCRWVDRKRR